MLLKLFAEQNYSGAAKKLLVVGGKPAGARLPVAALGAATVIANVLFNHDAAVMRR